MEETWGLAAEAETWPATRIARMPTRMAMPSLGRDTLPGEKLVLINIPFRSMTKV